MNDQDDMRYGPFGKMRLLGRVFGKLTVESELRGSPYGTVWLCRCTCGRTTEKVSAALKRNERRGTVSSCGGSSCVVRLVGVKGQSNPWARRRRMANFYKVHGRFPDEPDE